jgi:hypothetical protein
VIVHGSRPQVAEQLALRNVDAHSPWRSYYRYRSDGVFKRSCR